MDTHKRAAVGFIYFNFSNQSHHFTFHYRDPLIVRSRFGDICSWFSLTVLLDPAYFANFLLLQYSFMECNRAFPYTID